MPANFSTCARTSPRPASRPSARPCSNASLYASACRSARPLTVGSLGLETGAPTSGAAHTAAPAEAALVMTLDKLGASLAAQGNGALFGQTLDDNDDLLLRRLDIGEFHRTAGFHVVLEDFRCPLRHVPQNLVLHLGLRTAQRDRQYVGADLAQHRLYPAIVDVQQVVENEEQVFDLAVHLAVGLLDFSELLAALVLLHRVQDVRHGARAADSPQCHGRSGVCLLLDQLIELRQG